MSNRSAGIDFRNRVLIHLLHAGFRVTNPFDRKKLSELVGDHAVFSDIAGLEPWIIDVRTSQSGDISTALNDARDGAAAVGSDWYVAIMSRRGRPIEDAYAVLPLSVMTRIFSGDVPTSERRSG